MSRNLTREELIDMAENRYFGNVDRKRLDDVLGCFSVDATFVIQSHFTVHEGRDTGIRRMFEDFFAEYASILHADFETIADPAIQAVSSRFRAELLKDSHRTVLMNVNHWYLKNGRFQRVYVWMSGANVLV